MRGTVEVESEGTALERGWKLPEWMRNRRSEAYEFPGPQKRGTGGTLDVVFGRRDRGHPPKARFILPAFRHD